MAGRSDRDFGDGAAGRHTSTLSSRVHRAFISKRPPVANYIYLRAVEILD
jgi:hypothetical protein